MSPNPCPGPAGRDERGFALLAALLALVALSILAAAGVFVVRSDGRISQSHRAAVEARELARAGLSEYLAAATPGATPPAGRTFLYGGDTAHVAAARLLLVSGDSARSLLRLTSRGVRVRPGRPNAERTAGAVVLDVTGRITPTGAVSSGVPLLVDGGGVAVSGHDACAGGGGGTGTAGAAVPPGGLLGEVAAVRGEPAVDDSEPGRALLRRSGVDSATWARLEGGTAGRADAVVPPGAWPDDFTRWPVVRLDADASTLGSAESGRGAIVAVGDLTLSEAFRWEGLVLVGGSLTVAGSAAVDGAVAAGLDVHAGATGDTVLLGETATVRHDSCAAAAAAERLLGRFVELPGTRHEPGLP